MIPTPSTIAAKLLSLLLLQLFLVALGGSPFAAEPAAA